MATHDHYVRDREVPWTWANLVTVVRTVACVVIFAQGFAAESEAWNFIGLGVYWFLDLVDGFLARALRQETRLGAQMDVLSDRLLVCLFYLNYTVLHPEMLLPVVLFLLQFMAIDHYLSNQWMRWPIKSPNYFHLVDRRIWALNWSRSAKLLNTAVVTTVLIVSHSVWVASLVSLAITGLKIWSCILLERLPPPEPAWPVPAGR